MATIEPLSWRIAQSLLACLCEALAANSNEDPTLPMPQRCCFRAGVDTVLNITNDGFNAIDQCCLGEAYVKLISVYPSTVFPEPDSVPTTTTCQLSRLTVSLEMGTIRCISNDPDCAESSDKVRLMAADMQAMYKAVCCWQKRINKAPFRPGTKWFAGAWEQAGPDGGCLTGTIPVFASIPGPGCC